MSNLQETPNANRVHIGFFGRCNAGKSTMINSLTGQEVSLVSQVAGTTTDPVSKAMEILPMGPVLIIDTAGVDDRSDLGAIRIARTEELLPTVQVAVYVLRTSEPVQAVDMEWLTKIEKQKVPLLLLLNEDGVSADVYTQEQTVLTNLSAPYIGIDAKNPINKKAVLDYIGRLSPKDGEEDHGLLKGLVEEGDHFILVCPIDSAAPKGRLILPQVQMIREILDAKGIALVVQTEQIPQTLALLQKPPKLVITDSQAFKEVAALVPEDIALTSFSILMARYKGDLPVLVKGLDALHSLKPKSKVLISEGCTHHRQCDDIGTVKIPRWLKAQGYEDLDLQWTGGKAFPKDLGPFDLIIHCGACMLTRREVLRRIGLAVDADTPIVNYGVLISYLHGISERALAPFAGELDNRK